MINIAINIFLLTYTRVSQFQRENLQGVIVKFWSVFSSFNFNDRLYVNVNFFVCFGEYYHPWLGLFQFSWTGEPPKYNPDLMLSRLDDLYWSPGTSKKHSFLFRLSYQTSKNFGFQQYPLSCASTVAFTPKKGHVFTHPGILLSCRINFGGEGGRGSRLQRANTCSKVD